ncbi:MAG: TonB-dependent receptor, partial [Bacteroidales bacterium]|nr:TonB-dependent receptor [Bacteroidales bacterium]
MKYFYSLAIIMFAVICSYGQTREVSGKVTSSQTKEPLVAASVAAMMKGDNGSYVPTMYGAFTELDGSFVMDIPNDAAALEFSYVGMATKIVPITSETVYNVALAPDALMIETVVVTVPYGKQKKESFTGSLSALKADDIVAAQASSFEKALQGQVPGIVLSTNSGQPGASSEIQLRGAGSISAGSSPLIVIDGVPMFSGETSQNSDASSILTSLNPNDIENISILKDAAATSLYGSRASNGVIMVTTKSGKSGKTIYSFSTSQGLGLISTNNFKLMDANEYKSWLTDAMKNSGKTDAQIAEELLDDTASTDWFDEVYRRAWNQSYEFSAQGGNDNSTFFASGQYKNEKGIVTGTGLERFSIRLNLNHKASDKCSFGFKFNPSFTTQHTTVEPGYTSSPVTTAYTAKPTVSVMNGDSYNFVNKFYNPVGVINLNDNYNKTKRMLGNMFVEYKLPLNLEFKTIANADYINVDEFAYLHPETPDGSDKNGVSSYYSTNVLTWTSSSTLKWDFKKLKHALQIMGGFEVESNSLNYSNMIASNFASESMSSIANASQMEQMNEFGRESSLLSGISSFQYNYMAKYYLSASFRVDGSSKFSPSNRWAPFWSVGGSWIVSDESFMQSLTWLDLLKVRGSYGTSGNSDIDDYLFMQLYAFGRNYFDEPGSTPSTMGNPDLTWEKNHNADFGIDFKFLKRFNFAVDLYNRNTFDLLLAVPVSMTTGYESQMQNVGSMVNRGVELSLSSTVVNTDKFNWTTTLTFAKNHNEITELYGGDTIVVSTKIRTVGQSLQTFYLAEWAGVNSADGSPMWYDENGNLTKDYNKARKVIAGSADPKFTAGWTNNLTYGNWALNFMFYCSYGNLIFNQLNNELIADGATTSLNQSAAALDYWKLPGDNAENPKLVQNNGSNSNAFSTRYLEDGSYIRLKNIQLNYTLPSELCEKIKVNRCMIYAQVQNPFVWTKFTGLDPETRANGIYYYDYPKQRLFLMGLNLS